MRRPLAAVSEESSQTGHQCDHCGRATGGRHPAGRLAEVALLPLREPRRTRSGGGGGGGPKHGGIQH